MTDKLKKNINNRELLIDTLRQELIGPIKVEKENMYGISVDYNSTTSINYSSERNSPRNYYYNGKTGEEIIHNGNTPLMQYSTAIIFPYEKSEFRELNEEDLEEFSTDNPLVNGDEMGTSENAEKDIEKIARRFEPDYEVDTSNYVMNDKTPSSLAFTFYVSEEKKLRDLEFEISGGAYRKFPVMLKDSYNTERKAFKTYWWNREEVRFVVKDLIPNKNEDTYKEKLIYSSLTFELRAHLRQIDNVDKDGFFITVSLTNISSEKEGVFKNALFQTKVEATYKDNMSFDPYPSLNNKYSEHISEESSNDLLYFSSKNYSIGHGCSVNWDSEGKYIETTYLPEHEITNITPDIKDESGQEIKISMLDLAQGKLPDVQQSLYKITNSYEKWITDCRQDIINYPNYLHKTAIKHLSDCEFSLKRIKNGIKMLKDDKVFTSFQFSNLSMYIQQVTGGEIQKFKQEDGEIFYELDDQTVIKPHSIDEFNNKFGKGRKGYWRAFQIAFLLMSLPSLQKNTDDGISEREIADLIWFPTGGGKTEAYLGVAATTILYNRLINSEDCGTEILMRYTLRLLTADQFQRSARLICALELIRKENTSLFGDKEISIGLWVGQSNTPNKNEAAVTQYNNWKNTGEKKEEFLIDHCPLCRSQMGKYEKSGRIKGKKIHDIAGYKIKGRRKGNQELIIHCPNKECYFHEKLPIYLIDEQLYKYRPTFIIGTVDKFAMLAWEPKARGLFGIGNDGERISAPPSLIIQDELHLISGPLGSIVGIYESLIEELCTDYRNNSKIKPKIICATATVKGYTSQIKALFAREESNIKIFPSPGLSHTDSFFAQVHFEEDSQTGKKVPSRGRKYVGIASNLIGIQQLQVKTYTTILQTAMKFEDPDAYWTLLAFYNSIRELGGSLTLFQTDISNYGLQFRNKHHWNEQPRYINSIKELTSRLENKEVTNALNELRIPYGKFSKTIDVCLASNIIEVGVDVERLSLMSIVGQPKNTAQYIQVSGRVGRAWYERPGLVLTLYKTSMSRDKSHFEHFKEYHQNLYKQVEATSVTPFSEPSIERSLAGVVIAWIRQLGPMSLGKTPETINQHTDIFEDIFSKISKRLRFIDSSVKSLHFFEEEFEKIRRLLLGKSSIQWQQNIKSNNFFYMYAYGSYVPSNYKRGSLPVLTSMRNVDASCLGRISNKYNLDAKEVE